MKKMLQKSMFVGITMAVAITFANTDASAAVCTAKPDKAAKSVTNCMARSNAGDIIWMTPGVYTDAANGGYEVFPIQMKAGVALVGRNAKNTIIQGTGNITERIYTIEGDSAGITIDNVTITSDDWYAVRLDTMSTPDGAVVKNSIIKGRGGVTITNDVSVVVDNTEVLARDGQVSLGGTSGNNTLKATISNSTLTGTGPAQMTGEAAIWGGNGDSLTLSNVTITNMYENMQVHGYNDIMVDHLNGVNNFNTSGNLLIQDSKLGFLSNDGLAVRLGNGGDTKVVNTMLVGGLQTLAWPNPITLLNCYDENLNPVSNVTLVANPDVATGSITALLAKAQSGDTIKIPSGVYTDVANGGFETFPLVLTAGVSLVGENAANTIIQGTGNYTNRLHTIEGDSAGITIENLTITSDDYTPVWLDTMSTSDGAVVKNCIITGRGGLRIKNDVAITVDGCDVQARDWHVSMYGISGNTLEATVSNSTLTGTGPTQMTGEAAISGNGASLTLSNVTITNMYENFQVGYDNIVIDHLNGVNNFNVSNTSMLVQNSKLGFLSNDGRGVRLSNLNGTTKVVNTMFVNGLQSAPGTTTLLNVYDESLAPITLP